MFTPKGISDEDLRAAQDLKDRRDFAYNTNQSLQTLSEGIKSLSQQNEKVLATSQSDRKALLIEFENLRDGILASIKEMNQRLGDVESKVFQVLHSFTDLREEIAVSQLTKKEFYEAFIPERENIDELQKKMGQNYDYFKLALSLVKTQYTQELQAVKEDLTPKIPEIDPIKQQLDERFSVLKVDFDGLIREIALLKRSMAYDQKKFENVYTLIERLKEGKECHKKD